MKSSQQRREVVRRFVKNFLGFQIGDYIKYRLKNRTKKTWTYGIVQNCHKTEFGWDFLIRKKNGRLTFVWEEIYEVKLVIPRKRRSKVR